MTKGYKATYDYKCRHQLYEIGQEYKLDEKPILCERGFHYCKNAKDTLHYYSYDEDFKLLEIEDLNPIDTKEEGDKSCSNHIKIVREITDKKELFDLLGCEYTYNENGRILSYKDSKGYWFENTYDENNKLLTHKDSNGYWRKNEYDEKGRRLNYNNSNGRFAKSTYNENGKQLTYEDSDGLWCKSTYDLNDNILSYKNSQGYCEEYQYDSFGRKVTYKNSDGLLYKFTYAIDGSATCYDVNAKTTLD